MIINITEGIVDGLADVDDQFIDYFEELLVQHTKLFHYVCCTRRVAKLLLQLLGTRVGRRTQNAINQLADQSDSSISLMRELNFRMEIRSCKAGSVMVERNKECTIWVCSVEYASRWGGHPLKIIGENLDDGNASLEAARHYAITKSYPERSIRAVVEMSGGCGDADSVLSQRLTDGLAPVFCILDSDKLCPSHEGSAAIKKCNDVISGKGGVGVFYHTEERELENILPFKFIVGTVEVMPISPDRDILINKLSAIEKIRSDHPDIYRYLDLKNGTCSSWISRQSQDIIALYNNVASLDVCNCNKNCLGLVSPGIMKSFLDKVILKMQASARKEIKERINLSEDLAWLGLGKTVYSLAVSNNVRLT